LDPTAKWRGVVCRGRKKKKERTERASLDCARLLFLSDKIFNVVRAAGGSGGLWIKEKWVIGFLLAVSSLPSMYPFNRSYRNSFLSNYYSIKMVPIDFSLTILLHLVKRIC